MIEKSWLEYRSGILANNITVQRTLNNGFIIAPLKFPDLKTEANTETETRDKFREAVQKKLENCSIGEMDNFFDSFYL